MSEPDPYASWSLSDRLQMFAFEAEAGHLPRSLIAALWDLIARQLGHRDVAMVAKVCGRFKPDTEERDRGERIASHRDSEKWAGRGAKGGVSAPVEPENLHEESPATPDACEASDSSRGGTRTRDPGIMSAVL